MSRPRRVAGPMLALAVGVLLATGAGATALTASASPSRVRAFATFYGWYDNTPPGCATAYSGCAGGVGTFHDPITLASDRREFAVGTILYSPTWRKYFVMGDDCQECDLDWSGRGPDGGPGLRHVDLWIGGRGGRESSVLNCENALTRTTATGAPVMSTFVESPPADLPVDARPFFNPVTNRCLSSAATPASRGELVNHVSGACLGVAARSAAATIEPCSVTSRTRVTFSGASLRIGSRCLSTTGRLGSPVNFEPCSGGPDQEWEVTASGNVSWIQYVRCVAATGSRVVLGACNGAPVARWVFHPVG